MVLTVARKEFRGMLRDGRVLAGALVLLLLAVLALASAAARYASLADERAIAQALIAEQWQGQGDKNPHSAAHYGVYAFRPVQPLGFFDPGVLPYAGVSIWLEAHKQNFATGRPADDMTPLARFGELSLAFILQALVPLGLLLMSHAAFAGEREHGTLRQVLAAGITPAKLFLGKFIGLGAAALVLLAPLGVLSLAALAFAGEAAPWAAALSLLVVYLAYFALLLVLALVVSARAASSQAALLVLLAFWACMTFVVPRVAADVGRIVAPTPTMAEFQRAVEGDIATGMGGDPPAERIARRREALLRLYKVSSESELPINFQGIVFAIQDELGHAVYDKQFGLLHDAIDRQADVIEAASLLSPRMALALVSQELAGTSLVHQRQFERGAERFRRELMDVLNRDITLNSRAGQGDYRAGPELWRSTGEYRYVPEPLRLSWARCAAPLTVLALWGIALAIAAAATLRRLRVIAA
jgi:ABC-2 type transport system permease protein